MVSAVKRKHPPAGEQAAVMRSLAQSAIAELIGQNPPWVRNNVPASCRNSDGTYNGPAVIAFLLTDSDGGTKVDKDSLRAEQIKAQTDRDRAQAERTRLATQREASELIRFDEVIPTLAEILTVAKAHLEALPDTLAPRLPHDQRHELVSVLRTDVTRLLSGLAESLERRVVVAQPEESADK